ncbi:TonB-dependent hemoglobin/transferrin/lactoferrin family receptor [Nitratireductor soli]|uniref:TonB-dependent hemoglobin/transferrin/lactoferrin family receptor n=1 Tax=Nitratireductor soli TaxID=1670619 RepID=UPI00065DEBC2|nr:TonB-dependent hemoglobin/transferrin/lactoferrin family receptor [Nitratireductor soli]
MVDRADLLRSTALAAFLGLQTMSPALSQEAVTPGKEQKARAPAGAPTELDLITVTATMGLQAVIDALSGTSIVSTANLERVQGTTAADLFRQVPGVSASMSGDDPATAINIRGLQQYGRVAVTLDGARQDYWRVGHGSGSFFIEPELLKQVSVIRGPVSNAYGTGAIGGVVAFETKAAGDFLRDGETWALSEKGRYETNGDGWLSSTTGAYRFGEDFDVIGNLVLRSSSEYKDGNGDTVRWTGEDGVSGYGKMTFRPADGHEVQLGATIQRYDDVISGSSGSASSSLSRYDAKSLVENYTGRYTYNPFDSDFWDLTLNVYHSTTRSDQYRSWPASSIGETRYYDVSTTGMNIRNASRFEAAGFEHTLTYGGDYSHLRGDSDADHFGQGTQDAYGAFLQWEGNYDRWLDLTAAVRYDGYRLVGHSKATPTDSSHAVSLTGDRWSPRFTVGITPFDGIQIYGTYAEGYRTPHLQDVFRQNGSHGSGYEPNLLLRPEVASTWEAGVNFKFDDVVVAGDMLRAKVNVFHSDVDDYINTVVVGGVRRSENVGTARLRGIELEGVYDYGPGFINLAASLVDAKMKDGPFAGETLSDTPLDNLALTLGFRALDDRLTYGVQYQSVGKVVRTLSSGSRIYPRVDLVNVFANWDVNDNLRVDFGVDNVFDKAFTDPQSGWSSTSDIEQGKGRTFKIALTGRIGG